jgi:predicted AlkP superfamily phosphohydrolase/phosphomutase
LKEHRTLIIGLDGATFNIIDPLVKAGCLPNLSKLMAQGVHGTLNAWPNMNSASSWSSIVTGYNPGQHGIQDFGDAPLQSRSKWHPMTASERKKDPFWRLLSAAGHYVGVLNVPISYPADPIHGFMLAGMDSPSIHSPGFAHPRDLLDELQRHGIDYIIDVSNLSVISQRDPYHYPATVQRMVDARARTILHLMKTRPWDILMAVFTAPDRIQHYFYPDPQGSVDNPDWIPIRSLYKQIDSFFGEVFTLIDESTTVLIISDHGFGPVRSFSDYLNPLFSQLGLLSYRSSQSNLRGRLIKNLLLYGRKLIPQSLQRPLAMAFPKLHRRALGERLYSDIDWSKSQVFAHLYGGKIYINLRGRQPEGAVSAEDYESVCEQVRKILLQLVDPDTGKHLIRGVFRGQDLFYGPYADQVADLFIQWEYDFIRDSVCYRDEEKPIIIQEVRAKGVKKRWIGQHLPEGIFIASGPGINKGGGIEGACIYDITPTILYLQNHPVPSDMDGKVLTDIFTKERLHQHPVMRMEPKKIWDQRDSVKLDEEESRQIEERLRDLGYIE